MVAGHAHLVQRSPARPIQISGKQSTVTFQFPCLSASNETYTKYVLIILLSLAHAESFATGGDNGGSRVMENFIHRQDKHYLKYGDAIISALGRANQECVYVDRI